VEVWPLTAPNGHHVGRDAVISSWVRLGLRDRQLAVLRLTYPQWKIYEADGVWWASPSWLLTVEQVAAGVVAKMFRRNPVALMADLSNQLAILQGMPRPRQ
jgi:hypothetical protein